MPCMALLHVSNLRGGRFIECYKSTARRCKVPRSKRSGFWSRGTRCRKHLPDMSARTLTFESFPSTTLSLLYFENVTNGAEIKKKIVAKDVSVDAAFIDADMTPGPFLVHLAAYKALAAQVRSAQDDGVRLCTLLRAFLPRWEVLLCVACRVSSTSGCAEPL